MDFEFDPAKDAVNIAKHGVSLALVADLEVLTVVEDWRFEEPRFRADGYLNGQTYCLAFTNRNGAIRAISLRRAHLKEFNNHV